MFVRSQPASVAFHVTTNATNTPVSTNVYLYSVVVQVTTAGTSWVLTIRDKGGTPKVIVNAMTLNAITNTPTVIALPFPVLMTGGIDIITSGTTPGVADVFVGYSDSLPASANLLS